MKKKGGKPGSRGGPSKKDNERMNQAKKDARVFIENKNIETPDELNKWIKTLKIQLAYDLKDVDESHMAERIGIPSFITDYETTAKLSSGAFIYISDVEKYIKSTILGMVLLKKEAKL